VVTKTIASGTDDDAQGHVWYRGTDGALWADNVRIGVPADGRRIASTPTVSGFQVPVYDGQTTDPTSVLVRDDQGTSWLYQPVEKIWTNLGGIAT
jgi:hypothetical protein